jgi:hypothetical protein
VAVAAVAGVVAGTLVIVHQADSSDAPPVTSGRQVPDAIKVDRGPATAAEVTAAMAHCKLPGVKRMEPLWSRKVAEVTPGRSGTDAVVLAKNTPAPTGNGVALGLVLCFPRGLSSVVVDREWAEQPTEAQGMTKINGGFAGASKGPNKPLIVEFTGLYRVRPNIVRLQTRLVWKTGTTAWFDGAVDGGFAYLASGVALPGHSLTDMGSKTEPYGIRQEFRAYDSSGNPVPLQY